MKKLITALLCLVLFGCAETSKTILVGKSAPFTRFPLFDGTYRNTDHYKGRYLALLFWSESCAKSHSVLEDVNDWLRKEAKKGVVRVVAVNVDKASKESEVKRTIEKQQLTHMEHAFSGNDIYDEAYIAYDIGELPTLVLIDPTGKVVDSGTSVSVLEDNLPAR